MNRYFLRDYQGQRPFFEVYFGKVHVAPGKAFWFRYTVTDGVVSEAATWAVFFSEDGVVAEKRRIPLDDLQAGNKPEVTRRWGDREELQVFQAHEDLMGASLVRGDTGRVSWELRFKDAGDRYVMIPPVLSRLGIVKTAYRTPFAYARFRGALEVDGQTYRIQDAPGMIGHISGPHRKSTMGWAWGHTCQFDNAPGAVFEALSGQLKAGKPLTTGILILDGHTYRFNGPGCMVASQATIGDGRWDFVLKRPGVTVEGTALHPPADRVALLTYTDTDGSKMWCHNSKLSTLELKVRDKRRGIERVLHATGTTSFEFVNRTPPTRTADIV